MKKHKQVNVTLIASINRRTAAHKACVRGLGLRRIGHNITVDDTPENRGMMNKVSYLLSIEDK